jgi:hypothetical protein
MRMVVRIRTKVSTLLLTCSQVGTAVLTFAARAAFGLAVRLRRRLERREAKAPVIQYVQRSLVKNPASGRWSLTHRPLTAHCFGRFPLTRSTADRLSRDIGTELGCWMVAERCQLCGWWHIKRRRK